MKLHRKDELLETVQRSSRGWGRTSQGPQLETTQEVIPTSDTEQCSQIVPGAQCTTLRAWGYTGTHNPRKARSILRHLRAFICYYSEHWKGHSLQGEGTMSILMRCKHDEHILYTRNQAVGEACIKTPHHSHVGEEIQIPTSGISGTFLCCVRPKAQYIRTWGSLGKSQQHPGCTVFNQFGGFLIQRRNLISLTYFENSK